MATKAAAKAMPALATGALSGLANAGVDKIFGKGTGWRFPDSQNKIDQLIKHEDCLAEAEKKIDS